MSNPRSASNAWAKIKAKLMNSNPEGTVPATPKKTPRSKKIAVPMADSDENEVAQTPKKTPRKRAPKKQDVDGESSPKKKPARSSKAPSDERKYLVRCGMTLSCNADTAKLSSLSLTRLTWLVRLVLLDPMMRYSTPSFRGCWKLQGKLHIGTSSFLPFLSCTCIEILL